MKRLDVLSEDESLALIVKLVGPLERYEQVARQVAKQVGYLPLALRIIAGMAYQPPDLAHIADKLQTKPVLDVLTLKPEDREESVEASLALSYDGLDVKMQWRFRALGAFAAAPFDANAVAEVWGEADSAGATERVRDTLHFLARRGLLTVGEGEVYTQHDLLRAYALALLEQRNETASVQWRHALHYRDVVKSGDWRAIEFAFEQVRHGWESVKGHTAIYDYFHAAEGFLERRRWAEYIEWGRDALDWARRSGNSEAEGGLLGGMGYILWRKAHYAEALECLQAGLAIAQKTNDQRAEASILNIFGLVYRDQGQWVEALEYFERSLPICQQIGNELLEGFVLHNIGLTLFYQGRLSEAMEYLRDSLSSFERFVGLPVGAVSHEDEMQALEGKSQALSTMGRVHYARQQYNDAMDVWRCSLALSQEIGDRASGSRTAILVGWIFLARGELDEASRHFQDSLTTSREIGHSRVSARALSSLGEVSCLQGHYQEALKYCHGALTYRQQIGDRREEAIVLASIGRIHLAQGECERALDYFQRSLNIVQEIGDEYGEGVALNHMGNTYEKMGRAREAGSARDRAAAIFERLGIPVQESAGLWVD